MATNMLKNKNKNKTYSQSVTVKKRSNFTPDILFLKTLIEGDFTMSSFRQFQTSITLLVKKYFLMSVTLLSLLQVGLTSFRQLPRVTLLDKLIDQEVSHNPCKIL